MTTRTTYANIQSRLFDRLVPDGACLVWTGCTNGAYGLIMFDGKRWVVSRLVWLLANGEIPEGMHVLHHCDNPVCCNIEHLFLGTIKDNNDDRDRKGRHGQKNKIQCPQGHPYDKKNTYVSKDGRRYCLACINERRRQRRATAKA